MASHHEKVFTVWCLTWCLCFLFIAYQFVNKPAVLTSSTSNKQQAHSLASRLIAIYKSNPRAARVVLTTTNAGFLDMTLNMLTSIQRFRTPSFPNVTVITEDDQSYDLLNKKTKNYTGLIVQKTTLGLTTSKRLLVGRKDYNRFVARRPWYLLQFLKAGFEVLFADSDTFWVRDPFEDLEGEFDIAAHNEVNPPRKPVFCDGFTYYRPTNNTISLVREWVECLNMNLPGKAGVDQVVFNLLINRELDKNITGGLAVKTLNPVHYPEGKLYFRVRGWREKHMNQTKVLHLSYLHGFESKVKKLKELGWWLV